uniref:Uncharacterized protein n=1 Tax=Hucho hucho TaxID=62062 RepID=A0A4W5LGS3_9TELE
MSCEESYLAIRRYLTDEREPYAPGTHGNTKRKIRKAAACYVVRNGTLYYQRRQKGLDQFTELEVVLQADRRKELLDESHVAAGCVHILFIVHKSMSLTLCNPRYPEAGEGLHETV